MNADGGPFFDRALISLEQAANHANHVWVRPVRSLTPAYRNMETFTVTSGMHCAYFFYDTICGVGGRFWIADQTPDLFKRNAGSIISTI
jgi:hypothetical protein